jgi:Fur family peroxide stress response transcriptional regulator
MDDQTNHYQRKLAEFEESCRRQGVPLTIQRRAVLEALVRRDDHPTADQILEDVNETMPGISRTTVYRVLETLVRAGVAQRICHPGAAARFDARTDRHHHLVCIRCEKVLDIMVPELDSLPLPQADANDFTIMDYTVHFRGLCPECRPVVKTSTRKR